MVKGQVMKKYCLAILCFFFSAVSFAQDKIVVLDPDASMLNSDYAKSRIEVLEKDPGFTTLIDRLNTLRSELNTLQESAKVNGLTWSEEQKQTHRNTMQGKADELNVVRKQLDNQRNTLLNTLRRELTPVLRKVVTDLVEVNGYELIVDARSIIYSTEKNTINELVIEALNKEIANNAKQ